MRLNRRNFIKTGGMAMLSSLTAPTLLGSCDSNNDKAAGISFALNHYYCHNFPIGWELLMN